MISTYSRMLLYQELLARYKTVQKQLSGLQGQHGQQTKTLQEALQAAEEQRDALAKQVEDLQGAAAAAASTGV